jgi:molybdopterin molybdotransferase
VSVLPDYGQALAQALRAVRGRGEPPSESVVLAECDDRVLAEPVKADRDLPPFNRAMMDGYALRASDFRRDRPMPVVGEVPAGASLEMPVPCGSCVKIATGAPLPPDCDSVIQHELSDRGNPVRFSIDHIGKGQSVHARASDAHEGQTLVPVGQVLGAQHLGIAAAVGLQALRVRAKPQAWILTSGDEVVAADAIMPLPHQIRNSNGIMVSALLRRMGAHAVGMSHVPDQRDATIKAVCKAVECSDLVVTVGGVSAGERDHFPAAFDACAAQRFLAGASIQPGRPIVVGRAASQRQAVVVALPGNPVSTLVCACLFIWPLVRSMLGLSAALPWREIELAREVKPNAHRRAFRPAIVEEDGRAVVPQWAGSGDLAHTAPTHGVLELPIQSDLVKAGDRLRFLSWP